MKTKALLFRLSRVKRPGIVFAGTRRHAEELCELLNEHSQRASFYHPGLHVAERKAALGAFESGAAKILVATSLEGAGTERAGVRFVFHFDAPHSLDTYYRQIMLAGRDDKPAEATLFYRPSDLHLHRSSAAKERTTGEAALQGYIEAAYCRRKYLLNYHGEQYAGPCNNCDVCEISERTVVRLQGPDDADAEQPFPINSWVLHERLGKGLVLRYDHNKIVVLFDEFGERTYLLAMVLDQGLLRPLA